ncbi:MAG: GlsB/YeaQ/YmgE family stress response membrane protein [Tenericutes bacterium]|nr:GlsB/YeaQ/YmgE family stress response membrane protein [Mycoplasmatota bacterium]
MYILYWIIFGGFVGWITSIIADTNKNMGLIANVIVGLIGSLIGGYIASLLGIASLSSFSIWGFVFAVFGAVILLSLINFFKTGKRR